MNSSHGKLLKVLLVLHALLIYLMAGRKLFSPKISVLDNTGNTLIEPIKARLVFTPTVTNKDLKQEQTPLVSQQIAEQQLNKIPLDTKPETSQLEPAPVPDDTPAAVAIPGITKDKKNHPHLTLPALQSWQSNI